MACAFCDASATMSGEHVWSSWIGELFGQGARRYTFRRYGDGGRQRRGPLVREWRSNEIDLTANVVCAPCNNGWMSQVESSHAKPVLRDMILSSNAVSLLPAGIESIVAFTFLKAVIADRMSPRRLPFFNRRECGAFRGLANDSGGCPSLAGSFRGARSTRKFLNVLLHDDRH